MLKRLAERDWHASLTLQQLQHSGLNWKPLIGLLSITLTLPMTPMTHSLVFLFQHIISHFHLNLYILNPGVLLNPGFQKVSLYPVTGRILFINNSKQTLLNPTNLDITSIEISKIFSLELLEKNIFMTN